MNGSLLTFRRCSEHKSDFLNWPEMVFTFPGGIRKAHGSSAGQLGEQPRARFARTFGVKNRACSACSRF
jgi:hypothetical protein